MKLSLKNRNSGWPPGGYPFVDKRTGKNFDGMSADLGMQAKNVADHRKANPAIYPLSEGQWFDDLFIRQEIIEYMCSLRPELCYDGSAVKNPIWTEPVPPAGKTCIKCSGTEMSPTYCKTCSGRKVVSWKCNKCGTENPK
jgi:hypothetical protein